MIIESNFLSNFPFQMSGVQDSFLPLNKSILIL